MAQKELVIVKVSERIAELVTILDILHKYGIETCNHKRKEEYAQMSEAWKDINGLSGFYQISNLGRVKSADRYIKYKDGRTYFYPSTILATHLNKGYECISISVNSKYINFKVHRLVTIAFTPNPNNYPEVNHIDENKLNNRSDNLEWCSPLYNQQYGTKTERSLKHRPKIDGIAAQKHRGKKVLMMDSDGNIIREFYAMREAERVTSVHRQSILRCCKKTQSTSGGYRWSYA